MIPSDIAKRHVSWIKPLSFITAAVVIIFGASLLWNSTHSLSLASRTRLLGLKQDFGFYPWETTADGRKFRWTRGHAGLTIKVEKALLKISVLASHPDIGSKPVDVRISIVQEFFKKKRLLDHVSLTRNAWLTLEYDLSNEVGHDLILLLEVSRTWNPLKRLGVPDPRDLGIALGEITFVDSPGH
jgi:hypothetical protein